MSERILPLSAAYDLLPDPVACFQDGKLIYENESFRAALAPVSADLLEQVTRTDTGTAGDWCYHSWTHEGLTVVRFYGADRVPLVSDARMPLLTGRFREYVAAAAMVQEQLEDKMNIFQENDLLPLFAALNQSRLQSLRLLHNLELASLAQDERPAGFTPMVVDLNGLLRATAEQLESVLRRVGWTLEVQDECHTLYAKCDDVLVQTLLYHLVSNAIQANPNGGGTITLRLEQRGSMAVLSVMDDGVGMTPRQIACAFDPDHPRETLSDLLRGVGTGLTVCRKIARVHGGALMLTNRQKQGLRVSVSLPLCRSDDTEGCSSRRFLDSSNGVPLVLRELSTVLPADCFYSCDM